LAHFEIFYWNLPKGGFGKPQNSLVQIWGFWVKN